MTETAAILPEITLAITLSGLIAGEIGYYGERVRLSFSIAIIGLLAALVQTLLAYQGNPVQVFSGSMSIDGFSIFFRIFFIVLAVLSIVISHRAKEVSPRKRAEYNALVVAATLAMVFIASAINLLVAFVALLFLNIVTFFLAGHGRFGIHSTEAGIKHVVFGSTSLALFVYGFALLFAKTKTFHIYEMRRVLSAVPIPSEELLVIFFLIFLALAFLLMVFPMNLVGPDVISGSPSPVSAFLSLGPRAAGFAFAIRFLVVVFGQDGEKAGLWVAPEGLPWPDILAISASLTMMIGALMAFRQTSIKRLVSYLVMIESGFLLMGLLVLDRDGIGVLLYNLVVQLFSLIGIFHVISFFIDEARTESLPDLRGTLGKAIPECILMILFLACLVGLPPLPGFVGKFALVGEAMRHGWYALALMGIFAMTLSGVTMARLSFYLVGDSSSGRGETFSTDKNRIIFLTSLFILIIIVGFLAESLFQWARGSLHFILW